MHIWVTENAMLKVTVCLPGHCKALAYCKGPEGTPWHCMQHASYLLYRDIV